MENADDEDMILPVADDSKAESGKNSKWRTLLTLGVILIVYKGGEEMAKTTTKQYVFSWSKDFLENDQSSSNNTLSHSNNSSQPHCGKKARNEAEKLAAHWELYFDLLNVVLLFFAVSIYGTLSDYLGRKLFFCLALFGWTIRCGIISLVIFFDLNVAWLLLAYGIDGICGSHFVISMLSFASTADNTKDAHERILGIAIMEAILGVGKFTTQFGNGYFIKRYGFFYPMLTSTATSLLALLIAMVILKEPKSSHCSDTNVIEHSDMSIFRTLYSKCPPIKTLFKNFIGFYVNKDNKKDRTIFWVCLVAFLLTEFGQDAKSDPLTLYQLGNPFCWKSDVIGWYNTVLILVTYVVGCVLLRVLQWCMSDSVICCVGTLSAIAFFIVTGLARTTLWLFLAIAFGLLMVVPKSILKGIASSKASSDKQGAMFAGLRSGELVMKMIAGPTSLSLYAATLDYNAGMVFFVFGGIYFLSFLFMLYLGYLLRQQTRDLYRAALGLDTFPDEDDEPLLN